MSHPYYFLQPKGGVSPARLILVKAATPCLAIIKLAKALGFRYRPEAAQSNSVEAEEQARTFLEGLEITRAWAEEF